MNFTHLQETIDIAVNKCDFRSILDTKEVEEQHIANISDGEILKYNNNGLLII